MSSKGEPLDHDDLTERTEGELIEGQWELTATDGGCLSVWVGP